MVETLQENGLWHSNLIERDLVEQGGLSEDAFERDLLIYAMGGFIYKERMAIVSHVYNKELVVSLEGGEDSVAEEVMGAFSKIVEYEPFCKYNFAVGEKLLLTYEWDKVNPEKRFEELNKKNNIENLVRI